MHATQPQEREELTLDPVFRTPIVSASMTLLVSIISDQNHPIIRAALNHDLHFGTTWAHEGLISMTVTVSKFQCRRSLGPRTTG